MSSFALRALKSMSAGSSPDPTRELTVLDTQTSSWFLGGFGAGKGWRGEGKGKWKMAVKIGLRTTVLCDSS